MAVSGASGAAPGLLDLRLVFVTGKGGVGKTTVAAGLAQLAAEHGKRVLVCEVDAKGDVTALFEAPPTDFTPREIAPGVWSMSMDTEASLREYLKLQLRIPVVGRIGPLAKAFDFVATAAPGVVEYSTRPRRASAILSRTSGRSSRSTGASARMARISRRAHAPCTRRLISSVNAAWNGERTDCSSSETTASPTASITRSQIPLPAPATRPMASLVPTTKPRGSTPITRLSTIAATATRPATGSSRMIDHQLRQRPRHHQDYNDRRYRAPDDDSFAPFPLAVTIAFHDRLLLDFKSQNCHSPVVTEETSE